MSYINDIGPDDVGQKQSTKKPKVSIVAKKQKDGTYRDYFKSTDKNGKVHYRVVTDYRNHQVIEQPPQMTSYGKKKTMMKKIPHNLAQGIKKISNKHREYSIALDFERDLEQPERMVVLLGGKTETLLIPDFELGGHTHPHEETPYPSTTDLRNIKPLKPHFIVAGHTGKIIIFNLENQKQNKDWANRKTALKGGTRPVNQADVARITNRVKFKDDLEAKDMLYSELMDSKKGRDIFYDITGIKAYPYKDNTTIELKDDPTLEKRMPTIPSSYLEKYQKEVKKGGK